MLIKQMIENWLDISVAIYRSDKRSDWAYRFLGVHVSELDN
jgi:hypothetical protein